MINFEDKSDLEIIEKIQIFLKKVNLDTKLKGICILTVGIDKSSLSGCFVFNYDKKILLKHYPGRYNSDNPKYITINNINYTIQFDYNLPILDESGKHTGILEDISSFPLCCKNCITKNKLSNDNEFNNFINKIGSSNYIYKVTKKISFGPLEYIKFFKLKDGKIEEVPYSGDENKTNSFKIYTCKTHNTYFSIDLNKYNEHYNYHHIKGQNETLFNYKILELL